MDTKKLQEFIHAKWEDSIIPTLQEYIRIPCKSPHFDPQWQQNGYIEQAVALLTSWCEQQQLQNMTLEVVRLTNRTPLIFIEIQGNSSDTVLLYGHLDKQPEMTGWHPNLGPWQAVMDGDKLYGRGSDDDGYAIFSAITAIKALQQCNIPHPRCIILIEACEESGSEDLPHYMKKLSSRIGSPQFAIGLDSGCGNYEQLWCTTSLRGLISGNLTVSVLSEGVHSGNASGIVPSSLRIIRQLLDRIENATSGEILLSNLHVNIPPQRIQQAKQTAQALKEKVFSEFPFLPGVKCVDASLSELILNRTWRPALSYIGCEGIPDLASAGNVLRPSTTLKLSMRIPPHCDPTLAAQQLKMILEQDPPYHSQVSFTVDSATEGWEAPPEQSWLQTALNECSFHYFGKPCMYMGEGGGIPFMTMLGQQYPKAQFLITGVLGPHSNAHGPNEFLHIPTAKRVTCCVAEIISKFYQEVK